MYQFIKQQDDDGTWRFELGDISLLIDGFFIQGEKHHIQNPSKAIGFFNVNGHIYGVSNETKNFDTAEDFYDVMSQQYAIVKNGTKKAVVPPAKKPDDPDSFINRNYI